MSAVLLLFESYVFIICSSIYQHCFLRKNHHPASVFWWWGGKVILMGTWLNCCAVLLSVILSHSWMKSNCSISLSSLPREYTSSSNPHHQIPRLFLCLPPFVSYVNPPLHPSIPPSLLLLAIISPSLRPAHLPGLPLPFCRTSGRYGVCRIACMHLNEKLHCVPLPRALLLTFILFFFFFFFSMTHSCTLFLWGCSSIVVSPGEQWSFATPRLQRPES